MQGLFGAGPGITSKQSPKWLKRRVVLGEAVVSSFPTTRLQSSMLCSLHLPWALSQLLCFPASALDTLSGSVMVSGYDEDELTQAR